MSFFHTLKIGCKKQLPVALDMLKLFIRLDFANLFADKFAIIFDRVDLCLQLAWTRGSRALGIDRFAWAELHLEILSLVVPKPPLRKIIDAKGLWSTVAAEIHAVCASGRVGTALFGDVAGMLLAEDVAATISTGIAEALNGKEWTSDAAMDVEKNVLDVCLQMSNIELLPNRRRCTFDYLGCLICKDVTSLEQEVGWKVTCCWKAHAVALGNLDKIWLEDFCFKEFLHFIFKCLYILVFIKKKLIYIIISNLLLLFLLGGVAVPAD